MKKILLGYVFGMLTVYVISNISVSFAIEDFKNCAENSNPDGWERCYAQNQQSASRVVVNMAYPTGFMSDLFVAAAFENVRFRLYEALRQMKNNQGEQI
jgi:hypothetical protein